MTEDQNDLDAVQEYLEALRDFAGTEEIDDRDIALGILTPDYESQLAAIKGLLQRNYADEERATAKLLEMEADIRERHGPQVVDFWIDTWVDHLHEGVFIDAAHSMAAVGLVAPLIESLFDRAFRSVCPKTSAPHSWHFLHIATRWPTVGLSGRRKTGKNSLTESGQRGGQTSFPARRKESLPGFSIFRENSSTIA